jgi:hypothetical protein
MQQIHTHGRMSQELSPLLSSAALEALEDDPLFDADQVRAAAEAYEADMLELEAGESAEESEEGEEGEEGSESVSELEEFEAIIQEANALIDEAVRLQDAATASEAGGEEEEAKKPENAASPAVEAMPESAAGEAGAPDTEEDEDFVADAKKPARSAARGKSGASRGGRKNG